MIIPEVIGEQPEMQEIGIPSFYANKRIIGMPTIIQELANNYLNGNAIWSYYSRDQLMIYSNSRDGAKASRNGRSTKMDIISTQTRRTTYYQTIKEGIHLKRAINQIL
uniref:Translocation transactivator/inclusion body protein n=1 Tax=Solanum tuberosum TaxID=4113 RepID=M1C2L3_SOLTU